MLNILNNIFEFLKKTYFNPIFLKDDFNVNKDFRE